MTDGLVSSLRNIARMRKMTSGIFVDAADALEAKDKRIAELLDYNLELQSPLVLDDMLSDRLKVRIATLEALIIDVHEDLCCQTNYDDKIGFDKLDAEVTKIKSRVAMDGKDD